MQLCKTTYVDATLLRALHVLVCVTGNSIGGMQVGGQGFLQDVPHLLVWGGEGTRMDADIDAALQRWTPALRQSIMKASARQLQQQQQ